MKYLIGIGNYSMYDDSIGIRIIEHITENNLDQNFKALDLSSDIFNLFSYLNPDTEKILIVDTIKNHLSVEAGAFTFFDYQSVKTKKQNLNISSHEGDILKVIELAIQTDYYMPPIQFMAIQPVEIKNDFGLSPILSEKIENYAQEAINYLLS